MGGASSGLGITDVTFLGQFSPTLSPALPQATRVKGHPQVPARLQARPCAHSVLGAGFPPPHPPPPGRAGEGRGHCSPHCHLPSMDLDEAARETISQEQGPERVQIPALAGFKLCGPGPGPSPPVPLFVKWGQPQTLTPSPSGRLQGLSDRVWNLTGLRGKLGDGLTPDAAVQFLPRLLRLPTPSRQCTGQAPGLRSGHPAPTTVPCLGGSRGSWLCAGHPAIVSPEQSCGLVSASAAGAPPALPEGPSGGHSGGQGRQGL